MGLQISDSFHHPLNVEKRLLVLTKFGHIIQEELFPATLEFRDFSSYQDEHIKKEGKGFIIDDKSFLSAPIEHKGWSLAPLLYHHTPYKRNADLMPKTTKLLEYIGHTQYAGITALHPDFGLDWHHDDDPNPDVIQMRVFYTLKTCGGAYIEVKETENKVVRRYFKEREFVVFHSNKEHRVWNEGTEPRYSLVIDVIK